MWDFRLMQAIGLMMKTLPFIILRLMIYFGITLAFIVITGTGSGIGWGVGVFGDSDFQATSSLIGGGLGFALTAGLVFLAREYILYMVKAAHIAVLVELLDGNEMPQGRSQISHGQKVVAERFAEANVLFALDRIIQGVLRAITGLAQGIASIIPIPGLQQLVGIFRAFLNIAVGFIDEVILAYGIRTRAQNPWDSARDGLILYGQNHKIMLKNAAWLTVIIYGLSIFIFFMVLTPAAAIAFMFPGDLSAFGIVVALLLVWSIKAAVLEPLAIVCMLQVYFPAIEGQVPDSEWEQKLNDVSGKFREMAQKGAAWAGAKQSN
ncbi:MAG: hypothetical protein L3J21_07815 [Devosiaceae bacterium]|nr:hypothetical protein [Devosiaceae bacterium]